MTDETEETDSRLTRRQYLGVVGSTTAAVAVGATQVGTAAESGYGLTQYGYGDYGGGITNETSVSVQTVDATNVDTSSVTLSGDLTELQNADSASVYFEWGRSSDGLLNTTPEQTVSTTGGFEATLSGLDSDTAYEFRAVATADGTTATGSTLGFQTAQEGRIEGTPTVDSLSGADVSNPNNPHVDAEIDWAASINESELYAATLTLSDSTGEIESWNYELSGQTASATETRRVPYHERAEDATYTVDLTVYSYYGNIDQQTTTFTAQ